VPVDVAIPLGLLVNELITNAAKHGGPDAPIEVSMRRGADGKTYALSVTDDGPAVPANAANDESLGMRLITALASQLQAQIRFASDDGRGARVELLVPGGLTGPDSGASD